MNYERKIGLFRPVIIVLSDQKSSEVHSDEKLSSPFPQHNWEIIPFCHWGK